jgi:hypothetical protein
LLYAASGKVQLHENGRARTISRWTALGITPDTWRIVTFTLFQKLIRAMLRTFVLHDMFDLPFEEIAPIVGRSPTAARQLALSLRWGRTQQPGGGGKARCHATARALDSTPMIGVRMRFPVCGVR